MAVWILSFSSPSPPDPPLLGLHFQQKLQCWQSAALRWEVLWREAHEKIALLHLPGSTACSKWGTGPHTAHHGMCWPRHKSGEKERNGSRSQSPAAFPGAGCVHPRSCVGTSFWAAHMSPGQEKKMLSKYCSDWCVFLSTFG